MVWSEKSRMDCRRDFVELALAEGSNVSELCRRFGISRKTGYKWLERVTTGSGVTDQSRRPHSSPKRTAASIEASVLELRHRHPTWGGRKLRRRLLDLGGEAVPAASTISGILRRHGLIDPDEALGHTAFQRFEHPLPNDLWQMDFKGHFGMAVPASRYTMSHRPFPEIVPEPEYRPDDLVRKVQKGGDLHFKGRVIDLPKALVGQRVGLRPTQTDGVWDIVFAAYPIAQVDLRNAIVQC